MEQMKSSSMGHQKKSCTKMLEYASRSPLPHHKQNTEKTARKAIPSRNKKNEPHCSGEILRNWSIFCKKDIPYRKRLS